MTDWQNEGPPGAPQSPPEKPHNIHTKTRAQYMGLCTFPSADLVIYSRCKINDCWRLGENTYSEIAWGDVSNHLLIFEGSRSEPKYFPGALMFNNWGSRRSENAYFEITWGGCLMPIADCLKIRVRNPKTLFSIIDVPIEARTLKMIPVLAWDGKRG